MSHKKAFQEIGKRFADVYLQQEELLLQQQQEQHQQKRQRRTPKRDEKKQLATNRDLDSFNNSRKDFRKETQETRVWKQEPHSTKTAAEMHSVVVQTHEVQTSIAEPIIMTPFVPLFPSLSIFPARLSPPAIQPTKTVTCLKIEDVTEEEEAKKTSMPAVHKKAKAEHKKRAPKKAKACASRANQKKRGSTSSKGQTSTQEQQQVCQKEEDVGESISPQYWATIVAQEIQES